MNTWTYRAVLCMCSRVAGVKFVLCVNWCCHPCEIHVEPLRVPDLSIASAIGYQFSTAMITITHKFLLKCKIELHRARDLFFVKALDLVVLLQIYPDRDIPRVSAVSITGTLARGRSPRRRDYIPQLPAGTRPQVKHHGPAAPRGANKGRKHGARHVPPYLPIERGEGATSFRAESLTNSGHPVGTRRGRRGRVRVREIGRRRGKVS